MCLLVQATGVDAEDVDLGQIRGNDVGQHHGLRAQAVGIHHAAVLLHGRAKEFADVRGLRLQFQGKYLRHGMEL